tara:strand:+ start:1805 stop:2236 length:432 start_codon:yes stop_codon:yes gene_type:complete
MSRYSAILVISQLLLLGYLSLTGLAGGSISSLGLQFLGVGVAIWGIVAMRLGQFNIQPEVKASQLIERGPYKWIRNPMYLGILLVMIPSVVVHYTNYRLVALILLSLILMLKIQREEKLLFIQFGEAFTSYTQRTKRFLPFIL